MRFCSDNTKAKNMPSALHACILSCCSTLLPLYFCNQWGRKKFICLQRAVFMFHESVLLLSSVAGPIIGKTWQSADSYFLPSVALTSPHAAALTIWRIRPWPETFCPYNMEEPDPGQRKAVVDLTNGKQEKTVEVEVITSVENTFHCNGCQ